LRRFKKFVLTLKKNSIFFGKYFKYSKGAAYYRISFKPTFTYSHHWCLTLTAMKLSIMFSSPFTRMKRKNICAIFIISSFVTCSDYIFFRCNFGCLKTLSNVIFAMQNIHSFIIILFDLSLIVSDRKVIKLLHWIIYCYYSCHISYSFA